ncbi:HNH endonuclease [Kitasatospora purpeofusca]|uniref:HNH endonuclease n=1 Tax=Kitasatospora purpeofusca TaxID=67352 RepID=UPI0033FABD2B
MADPSNSELARERWRRARTVRRDLKSLLESMVSGLSRCMYCGDSQGTDIDHFKPIAHDPAYTFAWVNHFLACSHCNSNQKRDQYPCDGSGACLLVDPSAEDPNSHLSLTLATGAYTARTPKGEATIEVFGLQRPVLQQGRARAFVRCRSMLRDWLLQSEAGNPAEAHEVLDSLRVHPFADVLHAMLHRADSPGAPVVFGPEVTTALQRVRYVVLPLTPIPEEQSWSTPRSSRSSDSTARPPG